MRNVQNIFRILQLTPPGRGAVAVLRLDGPGAIEAVESLCRRRDAAKFVAPPTDRLALARLDDPVGAQVVVRRWDDNAVEVHCHGGLAVVERITAALVALGGQAANWSDQSDPALAALANARTRRTAAILLDQLDGAWNRELAAVDRLIGQNDFAAARRRIEAVLARQTLGRHLVEPWRVVLAGPVNAGKSRLMNAMAGYQRSIVHPEPGATRDALCALVAIDGWPVELCDTAGRRAQAASDIERAGLRLAEQRMAEADLTLLVFDQSLPWTGENDSLIERWPDAVVVHNKSDLTPMDDARASGYRLSAQTGDGLEALLGAISVRLVPDPPPPGAAVPLSLEQVETLKGLMEICRKEPRGDPISDNPRRSRRSPKG